MQNAHIQNLNNSRQINIFGALVLLPISESRKLYQQQK